MKTRLEPKSQSTSYNSTTQRGLFQRYTVITLSSAALTFTFLGHFYWTSLPSRPFKLGTGSQRFTVLVYKAVFVCSRPFSLLLTRPSATFEVSTTPVRKGYSLRWPVVTRADKGWAVKRARPSKKVWCSGLGLCLECRVFSTSVRACDVGCTLDMYTAAVTELWRLELFSCTSSSFLCAGTLSPRGKCCYFLREV